MSAAIGGTSGASAVQQGQDTGFGALTSGQFLKIMMTELQQQDPFQPNDSSKLLDQFSSLRNIESQLQFEQSLGSLVLQNQIAQAGGLIGKHVAGLDANNNNIDGVVTSVAIQNGKALLQLDSGAQLDMSNVTQINNVSQTPAGGVAPAPAPVTTTGTGG